MSTQCEVAEFLVADGWKEYPDNLRKGARCFYKRFDTPTRCLHNDDKDGVQVCIGVSQWDDIASYEIDIIAGLPDDSWIKLINYSLPSEISEGLKLIPRLIATWEFMANWKE